MRRPKHAIHSKKQMSKLERRPKHVTGHHIKVIKPIEEKLLQEIFNIANKQRACLKMQAILFMPDKQGGPQELRWKTPMKTTFHVV